MITIRRRPTHPANAIQKIQDNNNQKMIIRRRHTHPPHAIITTR